MTCGQGNPRYQRPASRSGSVSRWYGSKWKAVLKQYCLRPRHLSGTKRTVTVSLSAERASQDRFGERLFGFSVTRRGVQILSGELLLFRITTPPISSAVTINNLLSRSSSSSSRQHTFVSLSPLSTICIYPMKRSNSKSDLETLSSNRDPVCIWKP